MSNVHDDNVILVGRMEALSEDHKRVCTENSELKNQVKALKNEIATNQFSNYVFTKQELIDRIYKYFDEVNETPVVYHWKYKMENFDSLIGTTN